MVNTNLISKLFHHISLFLSISPSPSLSLPLSLSPPPPPLSLSLSLSGTEEGITVKIIKLIVEVAGEKISYIINRSLEEGMFLSEWKESTIVPVPKVGEQ